MAGPARYTWAMSDGPSPPPTCAPAAAVLIAGPGSALVREIDGAMTGLTLRQAGARARAEAMIVCHAPAVARRLSAANFKALDILELFAFVRPARFCLPTPRGVARVLGIPGPARATWENWRG